MSTAVSAKLATAVGDASQSLTFVWLALMTVTLNCPYARTLGQDHTVASALKDFLAKIAIVA
jgi:hypothetical protein